jgi:phage gp46-like protein
MGRKAIYANEEERKQAQREHALRYYYRRKALNEQLKNGGSAESVAVTARSKRLGEINEEIRYKTKPSGGLMKVQTKKTVKNET